MAELQVLEVKEMDPPAGVEPLHWILLTSLACTGLTEARRIVGRYTARWHIEEYHKALKSGAGVEDSQLEQAYRLETLIAVLSLVALRLLNTKLVAAACPDQALEPGQLGPEALQRFWPDRFGEPKAGVDAGHLVGGSGTIGRIYRTQKRWFARLANHLAWLATTHLDE